MEIHNTFYYKSITIDFMICFYKINAITLLKSSYEILKNVIFFFKKVLRKLN